MWASVRFSSKKTHYKRMMARYLSKARMSLSEMHTEEFSGEMMCFKILKQKNLKRNKMGIDEIRLAKC